ncbi:hypothetical protein D3C78_1162600 [compost metagenome]
MANCGPIDQKRFGVLIQLSRLPLRYPPVALRVRSGNQAALFTPIRALAAITRRSAAETSGRRSSSCDGSTAGRSGSFGISSTAARLNCAGGWPTSTAMACSSWARWYFRSMACASVLFSWVRAWATSALVTMPALYWFSVSFSARW